MKSDSLTFQPLCMPRPSSPKLRRGTRRAHLLNLFPNQSTLSFGLLLVLLLCSPLPTATAPRESTSVYDNYLRSVFCRSAKGFVQQCQSYLSELRLISCLQESYSSLCSRLISGKIFAATINIFSFTVTCPDRVAYSMLKHLPCSGMDFLHIFSLSWSLHSFPSNRKSSSMISIHQMGKPLDSPAFFRCIFLICRVSKLFERIIQSLLLFFLECYSILSSRQFGFHHCRCSLDQILYFSQSFLEGLNKFKSGSRTIHTTINFSKAFDSVWHPAFFQKFISAGLPSCFI